MNDDIARARLARVPAEVRACMMAARADLPAGAVAVVARFFDALAARGEHASAPSRGAFEAAAGSESTLALLLRALGAHAPAVCLSEGRDLRRELYRRRPGGSEDPARAGRPGRTRARTAARDWPADWLALLPGLHAAPVKDSTIDRHVASVNRCAMLLAGTSCPPRLGWITAWVIGREAMASGANARTAANYVGGLVSLGLHGGLGADALGGMRSVQAHLARQGRRLPKAKEGRIDALYAAGGFAEIVRAVAAELDRADALPAWGAEAASARATAAILAVCTNMPARTGDVADWTLGEEIVRTPDGAWRLRWRQQKTGGWQEAGALWPEVSAVIDAHLLGGRAARQAQARYEALRGRNWLSHEAAAYDRRWPSEKVAAAIGVPLHDLRTLAADYLRLHDPAVAPGLVRVLLGHRTDAAGLPYAALCTETAAQRDWQADRAVHAGGARKRRRSGA